MSNERIFLAAEFQQPADGEPIRSVITQSSDAAIISWHVKPGQRITPHVHPQGQDTWTVLSGRGQYQLDAKGTTKPIGPGMVIVAHRGEVHGAFNDGTEPLVFVSVVSPSASGYEPL